MFFLTIGEEQSDSKVKLRLCRKCETVNDLSSGLCKQCGANLPAPISAYPVGAVLRDKYKVERLLGIGGMGIVYQARHLLLERSVALKCIHPHVITEGNALARFQREAIAASSIDHPNALRVIDLDVSADKTPILVTELLVGRDLERCLQQKERFSSERIIDLLSQTLDGLEAAHQKGILHRDIKPQNLFLIEQNGQEQIKIVDFGLAKLMEQDKDAPPLTQGGFAMGTPAYMSPEQVRGEQLDVRADLWSIGVILYQLMTYRLPFLADSAMSTALAVLKDNIGSFKPENEAQEELWSLCKRALSKDKENRPESARVFREELQRIAQRARNYRAPVSETLPIPVSTPGPVQTIPQDNPEASSLAAPKPWMLIASLVSTLLFAIVLLSWGSLGSSKSTPAQSPPDVTAAELASPIKTLPTSEPSSTIIKIEPTSVAQSTSAAAPEEPAKDPNKKETPPVVKETPNKGLTVPAGQNKFTYAKSLVLSKKYRDGAALLEEVIKAEPNNASAHRWLGDAYKGLSKKAQAKAQWKEFIRLSPTHPDAEKVQAQIEAL